MKTNEFFQKPSTNKGYVVAIFCLVLTGKTRSIDLNVTEELLPPHQTELFCRYHPKTEAKSSCERCLTPTCPKCQKTVAYPDLPFCPDNDPYLDPDEWAQRSYHTCKPCFFDYMSNHYSGKAQPVINTYLSPKFLLVSAVEVGIPTVVAGWLLLLLLTEPSLVQLDQMLYGGIIVGVWILCLHFLFVTGVRYSELTRRKAIEVMRSLEAEKRDYLLSLTEVNYPTEITCYYCHMPLQGTDPTCMNPGCTLGETGDVDPDAPLVERFPKHKPFLL